MCRICRFYKILGSVILVVFIISGCSSLGRVHSPEIRPPKPRELPSGSGWWYARFRLHWPPDTKPLWYMDLYLAHQVILPTLEQFRPDIDLWRFHRRAARDAAGRQFSFIFYASPGTARRIFNALQADPLVDNLKAAGILERSLYDDPARITRPDIEDTSDNNWPAAIRKTWPFYIMGASQMWLNLVAEIAEKHLAGDPPASIEQIQTVYQKIDRTVIRLWQQEGRHAFMHHLNGLFEYKPLIYWEKQYMTF